MRIELRDIVPEGDRVATRTRKDGTHLGDIPAGFIPGAGELPGSGRPVRWEEADFYRVGADGRIVEYWNATDFLTVMQQLGAMPEDATS